MEQEQCRFKDPHHLARKKTQKLPAAIRYDRAFEDVLRMCVELASPSPVPTRNGNMFPPLLWSVPTLFIAHLRGDIRRILKELAIEKGVFSAEEFNPPAVDPSTTNDDIAAEGSQTTTTKNARRQRVVALIPNPQSLKVDDINSYVYMPREETDIFLQKCFPPLFENEPFCSKWLKEKRRKDLSHLVVALEKIAPLLCYPRPIDEFMDELNNNNNNNNNNGSGENSNRDKVVSSFLELLTNPSIFVNEKAKKKQRMMCNANVDQQNSNNNHAAAADSNATTTSWDEMAIITSVEMTTEIQQEVSDGKNHVDDCWRDVVNDAFFGLVEGGNTSDDHHHDEGQYFKHFVNKFVAKSAVFPSCTRRCRLHTSAVRPV